MKLSNELLNQAKKCKTAEEIAALAKQHGVALSERESTDAFCYLNKNGELSDSELNNVAGGRTEKSCDKSGETPKYSVGMNVKYRDLTFWEKSFDATGVIVGVSRATGGSVCFEWVYRIRTGEETTKVYEHQIYGEI